MPILEYKSLEKILQKKNLNRNNPLQNANSTFEIKKETPKVLKHKANNRNLTDL